jgi:hypothetical protein
MLGALSAAPKLFSSVNADLLARLAVAPTPGASAQTCRYRADASVGMLGVSLASRSGVGAAVLSLQDVPDKLGQAVLLRFSGGSFPERARGFNRLGFIEELVVERDSQPVESTYFGFITASEEESLQQARTAIARNGESELPYEASVASAGPSSAAYRKYLLSLPSSYSYTHCTSLITKVKETLSKGEIAPARAGNAAPRPDHTPRTFLYTVRAAMLETEPRFARTFLFNATPFRLDVTKEADRKAGAQLAAKGLTGSGDQIVRLTGSIRNLTSGRKTPFRLWYRAGSDIPLRFEYKARSFLGLVFEIEPPQGQA